MSTVGELRRAIANVPDDTPVVVGGPDHSLHYAEAVLSYAAEDDRGDLVEFDDGGNATVPVVRIVWTR